METMRAVQVTRFGGPETLSVREVPKPRPGPGQVLVRVEAAAVNPVDWKLREGLLKTVPLPFIPGGDFCGTVETLGEGVEGFSAGDAVYGVAAGSVGADAEFVAVPVTHLAMKPRTLGPVEAAGVPLVGMTAFQGLFVHGKLAMGGHVLILGASGGVGSVAVQLAKLAGARVTGTAATRNVERVKALGAERVVDYQTQRLEDEVRDADLCLDLVGGDLQRRAFGCVKRGGRLVSAVQPPDPQLAEARGVSAEFFMMQPDSAQLRELAARIEAGDLRAEVARILPLEKAAEAEELNRRQKVDGKIILQVYS